jgi:hypothetical protein
VSCTFLYVRVSKRSHKYTKGAQDSCVTEFSITVLHWSYKYGYIVNPTDSSNATIDILTQLIQIIQFLQVVHT